MANEKRLLFKFYSSYFEIAQELNDKDRLAFYDALIKKQFTGTDTELKGMANFAYLSQKHSIDKQVEGWEFKTKSKLLHPIEGGSVGGRAQEEVKEKEKEKEEVEQTMPTKSDIDIDFDSLLIGINKTLNRKFKLINDATQKKYLKRLKEGYTKKDISTAIKNAAKSEYHKNENYQYLTPEFFSRSTTLDKYADLTEIKEQVKNNNVPLGPWTT